MVTGYISGASRKPLGALLFSSTTLIYLMQVMCFEERVNINLGVVLLQTDDAGATLTAILGTGGSTVARSEAKGNGSLPGGGGLMEEMSALLARRYRNFVQ